MVFFTLLLITGISLTPYLQLGLDQSIALPQDSYLIPYFVDQATLLKVGAPVYFVIQVRPWLPSLLQEFF
jgi:Niemann-Pick C1 protein